VFGVALNVGAIGVAGISHVKNQQNKKDEPGIGIVGAAEGDRGFGVIGLSVDSLVPTGPTSVPKVLRGNDGKLIIADQLGSGIGVLGASGTEAGVRGFSKKGAGGQFESEEGVGVRGSSETGVGGEFSSGAGAGLRGSSTENRGGVFNSGLKVAQIRLEPIKQATSLQRLPARGKVGDLIMIRNTAQIVDEGGNTGNTINIDKSTLWLCTPIDPNTEDSNQWQPIFLGAAVPGTL
jgi:hypothetical protein